MIELDHKQLYKLLELPQEVVALLDEYEAKRIQEIPEEIYRKLCVREEWEEGVRELQNYLGDDPASMKILWEQLNILCQYTYGEYVKRGIGNDVFVATMKFCTRFLNEHYATWGTFKYVWAWWFPRQMMVQEFRIGALEYELVDGKEREIAIHIPSDADMSKDSIRESLATFYHFRGTHYPDWKDVRLTSDTWMLMPELQELLGENSRIVAFQKLFQIDYIDREATWYMGWIFPGYDTVDDKLPEKTTLQRELKKYLLAGNKFGTARGHIKEIV
ncbi:MAG: acyltransferase domain-containing protein [Thermoflexaceae bacterium]|nr:acyltransferase domain-containing protein [Thermoflexaceae bacterium]